MYRIIGISLVFFICSYLGYYYGEIFKKRCLQLKDLQKALVLMNSEILYSNTPLPSVFKSVALKIEEPLSRIYNEISDYLNQSNVSSVYEGFKISYEKNKDSLNLKKDDYIILSDFFNSLGESGVYGQEKIFNLTVDRLKRNYEESESEAKMYTKMYRTLGICSGAVLAIIFI